MKKKIYLFTILIFIISAFTSVKNREKEEILNSLTIENLSDDIYYFPAKKYADLDITYQPLKQFDLIFVGHKIDKNSNEANFSLIIPGIYTHVLAYIGKNANGSAYALEMNIDENRTFCINDDGVDIDATLRIVSLGDDFANSMFLMKRYDFMWAKRLKPKLRQQLLSHKAQLISTIKKDLINRYPFKLPITFNLKEPLNKTLTLREDTHQNGSDCVSYFVSLFKKVAKIDFDDIYIDAYGLLSYYLNNPTGREAILLAKFNPITHKDIYVRDLIENYGYTFLDNNSKQSAGVATPNLLFHSSTLRDIESVSHDTYRRDR